MRQYDVFENPDDETRPFAPLLVVLSSHHLRLQSVVFAPLLQDRERTAETIEVAVQVAGVAYIVSLTDLASVTPARLQRAAGSLADREDDIRRGLERLFGGF